MSDFDPTGKDPHSPGAKLDGGKLRPSLVLGAFPLALIEVTRVGTYGANKYTPHGWVHVPNGIERYSDAEMRHYLAHQSGEACDKESGLLHLSHKTWNSLAVLELTLRELQSGKMI